MYNGRIFFTQHCKEKMTTRFEVVFTSVIFLGISFFKGIF